MKPFICSLLFYFVMNVSFSQSKEVLLKKSFKVDQTTILNLDLDNVAIIFEESFDDKIHLDYSVIFTRYPKRKRANLLEGINVKTSKKGNTITLEVKNSMTVGINTNYLYTIDSLKSAIIHYGKKYKKNKYLYKAKETVLDEIANSVGNDIENFLFKNKRKYENQEYVNSKKKHLMSFIIKVPRSVSIKIKALHSNFTFNYDIEKQIEASTFQGKFKFRKLLSKDNKFILMNGFFQAEEIKGGLYSLKDVYPAKIGLISNAILETETSSIQIGEIGENVAITDFNSKFYFYNFSNNFKQFKFKGEYSALSHYKVKEANYSMNVFGFNTLLKMNTVNATFGMSKDKKLEKILEKKAPKDKVSPGNIEVEVRNGILNIK